MWRGSRAPKHILLHFVHWRGIINGTLSCFVYWKGTLGGTYSKGRITAFCILERHSKVNFATFCSQVGHSRGHFAKFSLPEMQSRVHFITLCWTLRHSRGYLPCFVFLRGITGGTFAAFFLKHGGYGWAPSSASPLSPPVTSFIKTESAERALTGLLWKSVKPQKPQQCHLL